jgi:putative ABC transport system permease protein
MATRRSDDDFSAEVQAHVQLETDRLVAEGMTRDDARAAALRAFGSSTRAREQFYERSRWMWLEQFVQDLRYAWRGLRASPSFLATTVVTLAVGLSLLTVAFTGFNAYVLRPFAVADASRLYRIAWRAPDAVGANFARAAYDELRGRTDLFDAVVSEDIRFAWSDGRPLVAAAVSANYFATLRPRMLIGRPLLPGDEGQPVAVIGQLALSRVNIADANAVGHTLDVDGHPVTIVGVVREEFGGLQGFPRDLWLPSDPAVDRPAEAVARLRAGVTPAQAAAQLTAFAVRMAPPSTKPETVRALVLQNGTANSLSVELVALLSPVFAAFALVLIAASVNVSNVMLARAVARHREISVRLSLGASRARVVRQLLTEGLLIAVLAGAGAVALAAWLLRIAIVVLFSTLPPIVAGLLRVAPMPIDYRVFLFAFGVAGAAALLFALVPALQASRQPLTDALRGQRNGQMSTSRMRNALVVAQVAVSVVLVVTALVLARNSAGLAAMDLGYSTGQVYAVNIRGNNGRLVKPVADVLSADPRIASLAVTSGNPMFVTHTVAAGPEGRGASRATRYTFVSSEYFPILEIPITRGRAFRAEETRDSARVAIVSESTARAFWPGVDPIGQTIAIDRSPSDRVDVLEGYTRVTVIGTVGDVVSGLMFEGRDTGHIYLPAAAANPYASALLITPSAPGAFRPDQLRNSLRRLGHDPDLFEIVPLEEMRQTQMYPLRAAAWVGALLGGIALLLSVSGLYGVLSYTLAQRTREIGIRMALGATAGAVVGLVMRQSSRLAAIGVAIGVAVMFSVLKTLASLVELRQISFVDVPSFIAALLLVGAATALAAYFPSRRATRIDPAETLRAEA